MDNLAVRKLGKSQIFQDEFKIIGNSHEMHALSISIQRGYLSIRQSFRLGLLNNTFRTAARPAVNACLEGKKERLIGQRKALSELIDAFKNDVQHDNQLLEPFEPSKTSKNGLNFVANKDLQSFEGKEFPAILTNVLKLIYMLAKEKMVEEKLLVEHLLSTMFSKSKVSSLKEFFLSFLVKNVNFSEEEFEEMANFYEEHRKTLGPGLMKISRSLSYLSFILKELMEYIFDSQQKFKGRRVQDIRLMCSEVEEIDEELRILEKLSF